MNSFWFGPILMSVIGANTLLPQSSGIANQNQTTDSNLIGETTVKPEDANCIFADDIMSYTVLSDSLVELKLSISNEANPVARPKNKRHDVVLMAINDACPQLAFHKYIHFVPLDGLLCADRDTIQTRSGELCAIAAFSGRASIITRSVQEVPQTPPTPTGQGPR